MCADERTLEKMPHHRVIHTKLLVFGLAIGLHSLGCDFGDENALEATGLRLIAGWPRTITGSFTRYDANLADIDGDRKDEVLIGIDNRLFILKGDGKNSPGWPQTLPEGYIVTTPAVGDSDADGEYDALTDIDGDRDHEIVAYVTTSAGLPDDLVYAWHHDGSSVNGWPVDPAELYGWKGKAPHSYVVLSNLDKDETDLEIVVMGTRESRLLFQQGSLWENVLRLCVFKGDGSSLSGWPVEFVHRVPAPTHTIAWCCIAAGNIDGEDGSEVIVSTKCYSPPNVYEPSPIFAYYGAGAPVEGWPRIVDDGVLSCPVLGDLDGGNDLEIVFVEFTEGWQGNLHALKHDGENVPGWPVASRWDTVVLADMDGDEQVEIISGSGEGLKVLDGRGSDLWTKPVSIGSAPSISPIGSGIGFFFHGYSRTSLWDVTRDREALPGFPRPFISNCSLIGQPSLGELDGDGMLELVVVLGCNDHSVRGRVFEVHALDLPYEIPATTQWPMYQHDPQHSGLYSNL